MRGRTHLHIILYTLVFTIPSIAQSADTGDFDNDGVPDNIDNCINVPNLEQIDSDNDGFGNLCDGDFDQNCSVDVGDYFQILNFVGDIQANAQLDLNSDGIVDFTDNYILLNLFGTAPGQSALVPKGCVKTSQP